MTHSQLRLEGEALRNCVPAASPPAHPVLENNSEEYESSQDQEGNKSSPYWGAGEATFSLYAAPICRVACSAWRSVSRAIG